MTVEFHSSTIAGPPACPRGLASPAHRLGNLHVRPPPGNRRAGGLSTPATHHLCPKESAGVRVFSGHARPIAAGGRLQSAPPVTHEHKLAHEAGQTVLPGCPIRP